jgi:NADPH:quinone reductase-like Zn-dependent oxidoreductase
MKAVYIQQHERIESLRVSDRPEPCVKPGEVLVHVEAAGINPSDIASAEGRFPGAVLPRIIGRDFAGRIVRGPDEFIGAEVWGTGGDLGITRDGTHAEYIAIPEKAVTRRPTNLAVEDAAIAGVPFVAAFSAVVRLGQVRQGEWVVVSGAVGAVGQAAIQVAKAKGARVIALVRDASELITAKSMNVEAIAQSDTDNLESVTREVTNGKGADLALNGVGSSIMRSILKSLAFGGRQVVYSTAGGREFPLDILSFYQKQAVLLGLTTQVLDATQCAEILKEIAPLFESGALKPPIASEMYPLSEATQAYRRVASGKSGKVVLIMPGRDVPQETNAVQSEALETI